MAAVDQSTRRGRLLVVFIGGLIIFGGLMLGGLYLSHQRKAQFEASQNGDSTQLTNEETKDTAKIADKPAEGDDEIHSDGDESSEATPDRNEASSENEESSEAVAGSGTSGDDETGTAGESLPATGPSGNNAPSEIPATGPEVMWIVAIIGVMAAAYAGFEYRRSRLAFRRAAMQRE